MRCLWHMCEVLPIWGLDSEEGRKGNVKWHFQVMRATFFISILPAEPSGKSRLTQNKLAYELIPPDVDPLSPQNAIIIGTGPFNGTMIPGCSRLMTIYKSPLNGAFPYSNGGGVFCHFLKFSGYDHVVITGRAARPVYIKILDDDI